MKKEYFTMAAAMTASFGKHVAEEFGKEAQGKIDIASGKYTVSVPKNDGTKGTFRLVIENSKVVSDSTDFKNVDIQNLISFIDDLNSADEVEPAPETK